MLYSSMEFFYTSFYFCLLLRMMFEDLFNFVVVGVFLSAVTSSVIPKSPSNTRPIDRVRMSFLQMISFASEREIYVRFLKFQIVTDEFLPKNYKSKASCRF